jgi:D-3-phosphoglycerate dehydrogenase
MENEKLTLLSPFNQSQNDLFTALLDDIVDVIGRKINGEKEFVRAVSTYNPDLLLTGIGGPAVTRDAIRAGKKLKAVVCTSCEKDFVDLRAATENGVFVTNVPDFGRVAVAEHVLGLMFAINRKIVNAHLVATSDNWGKSVEFEGTELQGKTLGILGLGGIGTQLALKAKGLGMSIIAYDLYVTADKMSELGVTRVSLETLLKDSDVVSIHVPLTDYTRKLIGEKQLKKMKKSAFLVNCARGAIVDEKALTRALKEGWIERAALDLLEAEPPSIDNQLLTLDNVIITPHIAWNTKKAKEEGRKAVREEITRIIKGKIPNNLVNTRVLEIENPFS